MKKRLRKKLFLGEFAVEAFLYEFWFTDGLSVEESNALLDDFAIFIFSTPHLECTGWGGGGSWAGYVERTGRESATEEDRKLVDEWLTNESRVDKHEMGPLVDFYESASHEWFDRQKAE